MALRSRKTVWGDVLIIFGALSVAGFVLASEKKPSTARTDSVSIPVGIRIKDAFVGTREQGETPRRLFADVSNLPLYVYAKDSPGHSACKDECAAMWLPVPAAKRAALTGEWSTITRDNGAAQLAFRSMPLYTYSKDLAFVPSLVEKTGGRRRISPDDRATGDGSEEGAWRALEVKSDPTLWLPPGIEAAEVAMAPGQVLVDNSGHTLYLLESGPGEHAKPVGRDWIPIGAPLAASNAVGEFAITVRSDGASQWTFRGKSLYRHTRDRLRGDVHGSVDPRFKPAFLIRYFMPPGIDIRRDESRGGVLMTASGHRTLYAQNYVYYDFFGGQNGRAKPPASAGEEIGTSGCLKECEKLWKPLPAPDAAIATGDWAVYRRQDGSKQWAYRGYALYTYVEDQPDEVNGDDVYDLKLAIRSEEQLPTGFGTYWRAVAP